MEFLFIATLIVLVSALAGSIYTVEQQTTAVVERLGRFHAIEDAGLKFRIPFADKVAGRMSLRVQQLDVRVETKTSDNVFVQVMVSVQYYVLPDKVFDAFYRLDNAERQITSFVFDVVRARVPTISLDDVFERKDDIADAVKAELRDVMDDFGYGILKALVTDIDPDNMVKKSMNEINAAQRTRVASTERGEAEKILKVKAAEADAESMALQGKGIADQRAAIMNGLRASVNAFQESVPGTSSNDAMNIILLTQYFDTMKEMAGSSQSNTILVPHSPSSVSDLASQLRNSMILAQEASKTQQTQTPSNSSKQSGGNAGNTNERSDPSSSSGNFSSQGA